MLERTARGFTRLSRGTPVSVPGTGANISSGEVSSILRSIVRIVFEEQTDVT